MDLQKIRLIVNGKPIEREVDCRQNLADFLRHDLALTGTHVGCEHGVCGSCTVQQNGAPVRSCLMLAVQADGSEITTVEGLANTGFPRSPLQQAFKKHHALQCGFCTPGFLMTADALLRNSGPLTDAEVRQAVSGNLCRCTGYQNIVDAIVETSGGKVAPQAHHDHAAVCEIHRRAGGTRRRQRAFVRQGRLRRRHRFSRHVARARGAQRPCARENLAHRYHRPPSALPASST